MAISPSSSLNDIDSSAPTPYAVWVLVALLATGFGCSPGRKPHLGAAPTAVDGGVTIHQPYKLTSIETGRESAIGTPLRVACASCHSLRDSGPLPEDPRALQGVHAGLQLRHGDIRCASCHQPGHYDELHLAGGEIVPLENAIQVCAQCHGPQWRDYRHGSHGGMTGHWDLSRGPRLRNHCVDCHEPHAPRFSGARPVLFPRDRIAPTPKEKEHG